jgi:hypothetical protein
MPAAIVFGSSVLCLLAPLALQGSGFDAAYFVVVG